jgi:sortase A
MKKRFANLIIVLGVVLICLAISLLVYNYLQSYRALENSNNVLSKLEEKINASNQTNETQLSSNTTNLIVDGNEYIGYLSIPSLDLKLPVMENWDYKKLKISPCHYYGSVKGKNLVIMAHNFSGHFGKISKLNVDDSVIFTDLNGTSTEYKVLAKDILDPYSSEEVKNSGYELTLFTCTYGGQNRIAIYCGQSK